MPTPVSSAIPADLAWTAATIADEPGVKRSVQVRLGRRIDLQTLRAIAATIKSEERSNYDQTFISYFLPYQETGQGNYATTHYTPELEVRAFGLTLEKADATLLTTLRDGPAFADVVGWWWADEPDGGIEVISQRDGGFFINFFYGDGSGSAPLPLKLDRLKSRPRFSYTGDEKRDTYGEVRWTIDDSGELHLAESWDTYARRPPILRSDIKVLSARHPEHGELIGKAAPYFLDVAGVRPQGAEIVARFRKQREAAELAAAEEQKAIKALLANSRDLSDSDVEEVFAKIASLESTSRRIEYLNELQRIRPTNQSIRDAARAARIEQAKQSLETALSVEDRLSVLKLLAAVEPRTPRWQEERKAALQEHGQKLRAERAAEERREQRQLDQVAADRKLRANGDEATVADWRIASSKGRFWYCFERVHREIQRRGFIQSLGGA